MKKFSSIFMLGASLFFLGACSGGPDEEKTVESEDAQEINNEAGSVTYTVDPSASSLRYEGFKVKAISLDGVYSHWGNVDISGGELTAENGNIASGNFEIDMTTITNDDLEDPDKNASLVGHLMDDDFFSVSEFPTASFEIASVTDGEVTGNLTIKGETRSITFPADITVADDQVTASADFNIIRQDWGIEFGQEGWTDDWKEEFIKNEINFQINLVATAM